MNCWLSIRIIVRKEAQGTPLLVKQDKSSTSTSSPLTWMMGQLSAFATSVQYGELRLFLGSVVNAT